MMWRFTWLLCAVIWVLYVSGVSASQPLKPPKCVERVCLERIERYRTIIKATQEDESGPIVFLEDDEGYTSADFGKLEGLNWVRLSFCESPGTIKTIHRTTTVDKGADYEMVLGSYEKRYGKGENIDTRGTIYEFGHRWKWSSPAIQLFLMKISGSKYLSIELQDLSLEEKDLKCAGRAGPAEKVADAKTPWRPAGAGGGVDSNLKASQSGMEDNMDLGLTAREVLYILSMQDAMQLLTDMILIQEKLVGGVAPAERESIRQELKRIREAIRKIGSDSRSAFLSPFRRE
jgi:hypothetical protein